jgi:hypothetical protein
MTAKDILTEIKRPEEILRAINYSFDHYARHMTDLALFEARNGKYEVNWDSELRALQKHCLETIDGGDFERKVLVLLSLFIEADVQEKDREILEKSWTEYFTRVRRSGGYQLRDFEKCFRIVAVRRHGLNIKPVSKADHRLLSEWVYEFCFRRIYGSESTKVIRSYFVIWVGPKYIKKLAARGRCGKIDESHFPKEKTSEKTLTTETVS